MGPRARPKDDEPPQPAPLGFASVFDAYQCAVYDRVAVADDVHSLVRQVGATRILDCAAGTGLPALDLRARGLSLECSDGDPDMVEQFRRNAKRREVDQSCEVRLWNQLSEVAGRYDYVLCRGNSLVYAGSWRVEQRVADGRELATCLRHFASVLVEGGFLQLDVPRSLALPQCDRTVESTPASRLIETEYEEVVERIAVSEEVTELADSRRWRVEVDITSRAGELVRASFDRYSSKLTITELRPLLGRAGFEIVSEKALPSDRASHLTVLARKDRR